MNWSRGFFRAWAIFTALWLLGCIGVTYGDWPAASRKNVIFSKENTIREIEYEDIDKIAEAEKRGLLLKRATLDGNTFYWQPANTNISDDDRASVVQEFASSALRARIAVHLRNMSLCAVLGPLIVLALGAAVGWILSGFRRT